MSLPLIPICLSSPCSPSPSSTGQTFDDELGRKEHQKEVVIPPPKTTAGLPYVQTEEARKQQLRRRARDQDRVKRAANSFMLYRKSIHATLVELYGKLNNKDISRLAGRRWKEEPAEVKAIYINEAQHQRDIHALINPGYKYRPVRQDKESKKAKKAKGVRKGESETTFLVYDPASSSSFPSLSSSSTSRSSPSPSPSSSSSSSLSDPSSPRSPTPCSPLPTHSVSTLALPSPALGANGKIKSPKRPRARKAVTLTSASDFSVSMEGVAESSVTSSFPQEERRDASEAIPPASPKRHRASKRANKKTQGFVVTQVPLYDFAASTPSEVVVARAAAAAAAATSQEQSSGDTAVVNSAVVSSSLDDAVMDLEGSENHLGALPLPPLFLPMIDEGDPSSLTMHMLGHDLEAMLQVSTAEAVAAAAALETIPPTMHMALDASLDMVASGNHHGLISLQQPGWPEIGFTSAIVDEQQQQQQAVTSMPDHTAPVPSFFNPTTSPCGPHAVQAPFFSSGDGSCCVHQQQYEPASPSFMLLPQPIMPPLVGPLPVHHHHPHHPSMAQQQQQQQQQNTPTATTFKGPDGTTFILTVIPQTCLTPPVTSPQLPIPALCGGSGSCASSPSPMLMPMAETPVPCIHSSHHFPNNHHLNNNISPFNPSFLNAPPTPVDMDMVSTMTTSSSSPCYQGLGGVDLFDQAFAVNMLLPAQQQQQQQQQQQVVPMQEEKEGSPLSSSSSAGAWMTDSSCGSDLLMTSGLAMPLDLAVAKTEMASPLCSSPKAVLGHLDFDDLGHQQQQQQQQQQQLCSDFDFSMAEEEEREKE
ncbi:hypothetical protein DFQ26_005857 [Actinomortierella ambigua]|nr:hypothetical protein DFQ26_005857 [Actinomortierella ambigua]